MKKENKKIALLMLFVIIIFFMGMTFIGKNDYSESINIAFWSLLGYLGFLHWKVNKLEDKEKKETDED